MLSYVEYTEQVYNSTEISILQLGLASFPLMEFPPNFKFDSNMFVCISSCISPTTAKCCTYQDDWAVLVYAKYCCDQIHVFNLQQWKFSLKLEFSWNNLVGWAAGWDEANENHSLHIISSHKPALSQRDHVSMATKLIPTISNTVGIWPPVRDENKLRISVQHGLEYSDYLNV